MVDLNVCQRKIQTRILRLKASRGLASNINTRLGGDVLQLKVLSAAPTPKWTAVTDIMMGIAYSYCAME